MTQHTPQDSQSELNKYGVPNWLIEAMKPYDGLMATDKGEVKGNKMKAKRELANLIEAYVTTRLKEAERLARIDELDKYNDSPLDWFYYEERRRSELKALTTTTNGKGVN